MANDCWNFMGVNGSKNAIRTILTKLELMSKKEGVFETLIGIDLSIPRHDMWDYNIERYGCRSDIGIEDFDYEPFDTNGKDEGEWGFSVNFMTPWSPPINFFRELSRIYGVEVEYCGEEMGEDLYQKGTFKNGEVIEEHDWGYTEGMYYDENENFWDNLEYGEIENIYEEYFDEENPDDDSVAFAYIQNTYSFVNDTDMEEIKSLYKTYKDEQLSDAN